MSGTDASFAVLYDRHRGRVFRHAYSYLRNVSEAEDAVAIVFLEAWRRRADVRIVDGSLLPWLLSTTTYVCLNSRRTRRRYDRLLAKIPIEGDAPDHAEQFEQDDTYRQRAEVVREAVSKLPSADIAIVTLCIVEELPLVTVAAALDIPIGTAKARISRARKKLRGILLENPATAKLLNFE